jgi:hypothetical protein
MDRETIRDYELDIIVKAWRDEKFRQSLLRDAKKAIEKEFDIEIPKHVRISVHEEDENSLHLIVPAVPANFSADELSDDELREVIGGVIASGHITAFPNSEQRTRIRVLHKENQELHKMIHKLKADLSELESQLIK